MDNKEIQCPVCNKGFVTRGINTCSNPECNKQFSKIDMAKISKGTYKVSDKRINSTNVADSKNKPTDSESKKGDTTPDTAVSQKSSSHENNVVDEKNNKKHLEDIPNMTQEKRKLSNREILNNNTRHCVNPIHSEEQEDKEVVKEKIDEQSTNTEQNTERFVSKLHSASTDILKSGEGVKQTEITVVDSPTHIITKKSNNIKKKVVFTSIDATKSASEVPSKDVRNEVSNKVNVVNNRIDERIEKIIEPQSEEIDINDEFFINQQDVLDDGSSILSAEETPGNRNASVEKAKTILKKVFVDGFLTQSNNENQNILKTEGKKGFFKSKDVNEIDTSVDYDFNADGFYDDVKLYDSTEPIYFSKKRAIIIVGYILMFVSLTVLLIYKV